ncbi:hypothetical protein ACQCWI_28165 [Bacillus thuringiensis]|uniref:hypothetical protein n=1 Tax=Bacillus thuringiensis TaxID=1428 RepID=UPI003CF11770
MNSVKDFFRFLPVYLFLAWSVCLAVLVMTNKINIFPGYMQFILTVITILGLIMGIAQFFGSSVEKFNQFFISTLFAIGIPLLMYYLVTSGLFEEFIEECIKTLP